MNHLDIALIVLIIIFFIIGWKLRGIFIVIIPAAFFIGVFFANITYPIFARIISPGVPNEVKRHLIAYCIAFVIAAGAVVIIGVFLAKGFDFLRLTFVDRTIGAVVLITVLLVPLYLLLAFMDKQLHFNLLDFHNALHKSLLFPKIEKYVFFIIRLPVLKHLSVIETILK
jgi:uncharacterized membrane protein required for colicin V production